MPKIDKDKRKYVDATFMVIESMEELRDVWRKTAPFYELEEKERIEVEKTIKKVRKALDIIEEVVNVK
ncbi:MAG: hypothetical protein QMD92_06725 [bacterium]|nr:hypothetical protein [bacterium]